MSESQGIIFLIRYLVKNELGLYKVLNRPQIYSKSHRQYLLSLHGHI